MDTLQCFRNNVRLLRECFTKWNGQEVDTQGDSFFVSFPRATQAVSAAVEIQRTLHEHKWPESVEVHLRMGLHTGEPLSWDEGYVGMDVHRAGPHRSCWTRRAGAAISHNNTLGAR